MKANTKTQRCMDLLELFPVPTTLDVQNVAKKIGCSEITGWRALRYLRENKKMMLVDVSQKMRIIEGLVFCVSMLQKYGFDRLLTTARDFKYFWKLEGLSKELQEEYRLDSAGRSIKR